MPPLTPPASAPARTPAPDLRIGTKIHSIKVDCLKNLNNLSELSFDGHPITGIFGPNCCGKSTVLHALACCYQPPAGSSQFNYKFCHFFLPNTDALWDGSKITIYSSHKFQGVDITAIDIDYYKTSTRWTPRYDKRPSRHVCYIGVSSCVPSIELEKSVSKINYTTTARTDDAASRALAALSCIFGKDYTALNDHQADRGRRYKGLELAGLKYSALSMGAGEQRLLHILEEIYSARKYGLILIDEIDLLLHGDALRRFIELIYLRAVAKELQIVFTSHRQLLLEFEDKINIRHLHTTEEGTCCFNETKPDALRRLTGQQQRPLELFVEDDLAATIVNKVAGALQLRKYVSVTRYGAAINAFTVAAGLVVKGDSLDKSLFVLDGDLYVTQQEKEDQIKRILTGHGDTVEEHRNEVLSSVQQFNLPADISPEQYLHSMIVNLPDEDLEEEHKELKAEAQKIVAPADRHAYVDQIIENMGIQKDAGLKSMIDLAARSPDWDVFVEPINTWLATQKPHIEEQINA